MDSIFLKNVCINKGSSEDCPGLQPIFLLQKYDSRIWFFFYMMEYSLEKNKLDF